MAVYEFETRRDVETEYRRKKRRSGTGKDRLDRLATCLEMDSSQYFPAILVSVRVLPILIDDPSCVMV